MTREERQIYHRAYYLKNRKRLIANSRKWQIEHAEHRASYLKGYYSEHLEEITGYKAAWFKKANKGDRSRLNFNLKRYRARKRTSGGRHKLQDWLDLKRAYGNTCPACGRKEPEIKLTEDHVVAIVNGGTDDITNMQPLCHSCNCRKSRKTIKYDPVMAVT